MAGAFLLPLSFVARTSFTPLSLLRTFVAFCGLRLTGARVSRVDPFETVFDGLTPCFACMVAVPPTGAAPGGAAFAVCAPAVELGSRSAEDP